MIPSEHSEYVDLCDEKFGYIIILRDTISTEIYRATADTFRSEIVHEAYFEEFTHYNVWSWNRKFTTGV